MNAIQSAHGFDVAESLDAQATPDRISLKEQRLPFLLTPKADSSDLLKYTAWIGMAYCAYAFLLGQLLG